MEGEATQKERVPQLRPVAGAAKRDPVIDIMRVLGLSLIILAHMADFPRGCMPFRTFDVVMMVFISGLSYAGRQVKGGLLSFYTKRTLRLVVPVWMYLAALYAATHFLAGGYYTPRTMLDGFLLGQKMPYVWIIRVFLLMMLLVPLMAWLQKKRGRLLAGAGVWVLMCMVQEVLISCQATDNLFVNQWVYYAVGYGVALYAGVLAKGLPRPVLLVAGLCVLAGALATVACGGPFSPALSKYPPHGQYLLYGIGMSLLVMWLLHTPCMVSIRRRLARGSRAGVMCVGFVARHSIWIYLHHIALVTLLYPHRTGDGCWVAGYAAVYLGAILLTALQIAVVKRLAARTGSQAAKLLSAYLTN